MDDDIKCSHDESRYLFDIFNGNFPQAINGKSIVREFNGFRLIIASKSGANESFAIFASRVAKIAVINKFVTF
jgi:hypothetical protein